MSRISKQTRAEAIHILDMFAGTATAIRTCGSRPDTRCFCLGDHGTVAASDLADAAMWEVPEHHSDTSMLAFAKQAAEAAGLLRDGWCPGDGVILLRRPSCETCGQALKAEVGLS